MLKISKYNSVLLCFLSIICVACNMKENPQIKKSNINDKKIEKKIEKKEIEIGSDTINKNNAIKFLTGIWKIKQGIFSSF